MHTQRQSGQATASTAYAIGIKIRQSPAAAAQWRRVVFLFQPLPAYLCAGGKLPKQKGRPAGRVKSQNGGKALKAAEQCAAHSPGASCASASNPNAPLPLPLAPPCQALICSLRPIGVLLPHANCFGRRRCRLLSLRKIALVAVRQSHIPVCQAHRLAAGRRAGRRVRRPFGRADGRTGRSLKSDARRVAADVT